MDTTLETKTFRGRSLEEVLPQIRAELGPEAIVVRRREGLAGGVAGFFQRSFVEGDARPAHDDEKPLEARNDRATTERLAAAYAAADADVVVVSLDGGVGLAGRLEPLGVSVIAGVDAEEAARR